MILEVDPWTVLISLAPDATGPSVVNTVEAVPYRIPDVTVTDRLRDTMWDVRHLIVVSDIHAVSSHAVPLSRWAEECDEPEMLRPTIVMLREPVPPGRFDLPCIRDTDGALKEIAADMVLPLPRHDVVNTTLKEPPTPDAPAHQIEVSEFHSVPSHLVNPILTLMDRLPALSPSIAISTTSSAPGPVLEGVPDRITTKSADTIWETLPDPPATVTTDRLLALASRPIGLDMTDVPDDHTVASHPVPPSRCDIVYGPRPSPDPYIVRLTEPVYAAPFDRYIALIVAEL